MIISKMMVAVLVVNIMGCSKRADYVGYYAKPGNVADYTEIREDGTFSFKDRGLTVSGNYTVAGDKLILVVPNRGSSVGFLKPGKIVDNEGVSWLKVPK